MKYKINMDEKKVKELKKQGFTDAQISAVTGAIGSVSTESSRITSGLFGIVSKNQQVAEFLTDKGKSVKKLNVDKAIKLSEETSATFQPVLSLLQSQNLAYNLKNADKGVFNANHREFALEYKKVVIERCDLHESQCIIEESQEIQKTELSTQLMIAKSLKDTKFIELAKSL